MISPKNCLFPKLICIFVAALASSSALAEQAASGEAAKPYSLTGHVDLVSAYYLRGATATYGNSYPGLGNAGADAPESSKPVLQWGADFTHESGWYAGYWGSQINYSYQRLGESYDDQTIVSGFQEHKSIENDFYGGYTGKSGDFSYALGFTAYYYINGKHADALETKIGIGYKDLALTAQTLLSDTVWGNKNDTYFSLVYTSTLPHEITFTANLGWYLYAKEGQYLGTRNTLTGVDCGAGNAFVVNGCYAGNQPVGSAFRHLILGVSQPIGRTGLTWSAQAILAGENRYGVQQSNKGMASLSYAF